MASQASQYNIEGIKLHKLSSLRYIPDDGSLSYRSSGNKEAEMESDLPLQINSKSLTMWKLLNEYCHIICTC